MHFAIACVLPAIISCVRVLSSSVPVAHGEATRFYKNITRTIGGEPFTLFNPCELSTDMECRSWCLSAGLDQTLLQDCETDCEDDYCEGSSEKIEFPRNSGQFVYPSELIERARDERLARLHATYYPNTTINARSSLQRRDLSTCLLTCRTFAQFATYIPYIVPRTIANGLARLACPAICYETFGLHLTEDVGQEVSYFLYPLFPSKSPH
jgi:hypothetical protein